MLKSLPLNATASSGSASSKTSASTGNSSSTKTTSTASKQSTQEKDDSSKTDTKEEAKTTVIKIEGVKTTVPDDGNVWIKSKGYFHFVKDGKLIKGWKHFTEDDGEKIDHYSYFDKNGRLYTGWHEMGKTEGEKTKHFSYFGENGWLRKGWQKMGTKNNPDGKNKEHFSYFGENGWLCTGWQWMDKAKGESKNHWSYFDGGGWLTTKTVKLNGMTCYFSNAGWLTKFETVTPHYNQYKYGYLTGCAGTNLLMALQYKGHLRDRTLPQFMDTMPYTNDGNPNNGFVGNPKNFYLTDKNRGIYPKAIAKWGARYGDVVDFSGNDMNKVTDEVRKGNPVMVLATWNLVAYKILHYSWGDYRPENHHFFLVVGYDYNTDMYKVMDPLVEKGDGSKWLDGQKLRTVYNQIKGAVSIRG